MKTSTKHWASIAAGVLSFVGYASAANLGSEKYVYDSAGNIIEKWIDGKVTKFSHDQSNCIVERGLSGQNTETISYDGAGRPNEIKDERTRQTRNLVYGYGDKVIGFKTATDRAAFYYNSEGQMIGKEVVDRVFCFSWDGNVLAAEGSQPFTNENHISGGVPVMASGVDVVVSDVFGNTLASGVKQFSSTAYGEGLAGGRFTGKMFVEELGSFVFHHRLYSPELNRWMTPDPIGYPDGFNNFVYISDPNSGVDSEGTTITEIANTVAPPYNSPQTLSGGNAPLQTCQFTCTGSRLGNNAMGFNASISHTSTAAGAPNPKQAKVSVTIIESGQNLFYTVAPNVPQGVGTHGSMGITAIMTGNGTRNITANVSGAYALAPAVVSSLGVTAVATAPNASFSTPGNGPAGPGNTFTFGSGAWEK